MTTPVEVQKQGFQVNGVFYDYVPMSEWGPGDCALARVATRVGLDELVSGKADFIAVQTAFLAVAVWRANPGHNMDRIIQHVYAMKLTDIEEIGFDDDLEPEEADVPLDEHQPKNSAETGDSPSEASLES